ncbi:MAG: T9SS type A sorting domain-containing protein, partial [Gemmatimonadetes bacterium]|nr:T9SS type A sorting domain-containing protein [Gemmatimonadota bacterium]
AITYTAEYRNRFFFDLQDPPYGASTPASAFHDAGTQLSVNAFAPGYAFVDWVGTGPGSYTGTQNPATVTMDGPVVQTPSFIPLGYELSISASATDPFQNTDVPGGTNRLLYLWLTCSDDGISALEADVTGDLTVVDFAPATGVFNAGTSTELLLAVSACPGASAPYLLGFLVVDDTGGSVCLGPSAANGILGAVDCVGFGVTDPIQVTGFSSGGAGPCFLPGIACQDTTTVAEVLAEAADREVRVTWPSRARGSAAFQVYRAVHPEGPYHRVNRVEVGGATFVDATVEESTTYHYQVSTIVAGSESVIGAAEVTTPAWEPLVFSFSGARPNPFSRETDLHFTVARDSRVTVTVYDVAGRRVRQVHDGLLLPGRHRIAWDGRNGNGAHVPAGVYLARVEMGDFRESRKIVLLGTR